MEIEIITREQAEKAEQENKPVIDPWYKGNPIKIIWFMIRFVIGCTFLIIPALLMGLLHGGKGFYNGFTMGVKNVYMIMLYVVNVGKKTAKQKHNDIKGKL